MVELTIKQIKSHKSLMHKQKKYQYALIKKHPSVELFNKLDRLYNSQGLFYKVFLLYENIKKQLKM